jgi:hypothetical protein
MTQASATTPMTDAEKRTALTARLQRKLKRSTAFVAQWHEKFSVQAAAADLEHMDGVFEAAAQIRIFNLAIDRLQVFNTYELAIAFFHTSLLERARIPTKSTSVTANLLYQSVVSAWADVVDEAGYVG